MSTERGSRLHDLTDREHDVARLMARGLTNPQIAEALGISFNTAKWHVSHVISKLGVNTREEAIEVWRTEQSVDLTDANLSGALTASASFEFVTWSNTTCTDGTNSDANGNTCAANLAVATP